jgi:hypothetical protein
MSEVSAHVYKGCVVDDLRLLGLPIMTEGTRWAYWLGVRVSGLNGEPSVMPVQFR